jgi:hypothetical protein
MRSSCSVFPVACALLRDTILTEEVAKFSCFSLPPWAGPINLPLFGPRLDWMIARPPDQGFTRRR